MKCSHRQSIQKKEKVSRYTLCLLVHPVACINTSAVRKRTTTYNEKRDYHSVLQKFGEIYDVKYYRCHQYICVKNRPNADNGYAPCICSVNFLLDYANSLIMCRQDFIGQHIYSGRSMLVFKFHEFCFQFVAVSME